MNELGLMPIFVATAPGLEPVLAQELEQLGVVNKSVLAGGVEFEGDAETVMEVNLRSRTAARVIVRLGRFRAAHLAELRRKAGHIDFRPFVDGALPVRVEATCRRSRIYHSGAAAERVERAVHEQLGSVVPSRREPGDSAQRLFVRLDRDVCTVSVDSSGALLHRRGYRVSATRAPLRENLAAAMLSLIGWNARQPLVDPMCGSGTFVIEAALLASGRVPGLARTFAMERWPAVDSAVCRAVRERARSELLPFSGEIIGSDRDPKAIEAARLNAERAGVADLLRFDVTPLSEVSLPSDEGLVICNPPYGRRLGSPCSLSSLYRSLGSKIEGLEGWGLGLLTSSKRLATATGLSLSVVSPWFPSGGIRVRLYSTRSFAVSPR
jgi:putative N6-adenine-specific DNA methylase